MHIRSADEHVHHRRAKLPSLVWATAWVSFFADVSTELIYGVLPAYYLGALSLSIVSLGVIEGLSETLVSLTKLFSGSMSDRTGRRKVWMVAGYGLAAMSKPLLALAGTGASVAALRAMDRFGKGVRGAPRDALVAAAVEHTSLGRAFGVQRALDHAGALTGGLVAAALLALGLVSIHQMFLLAFIPGAVAVSIIVFFVREPKAMHKTSQLKQPFSPKSAWREAPPALKRYLLPRALFALASSSDMLLLALCYQRFLDAGQSEQIAMGQLPLLWALLHVVKAVGSTWGGALSDRAGRLALLRWAWVVYALVYALAGALAAGGPIWLAWIVFASYGMFTALAEGPEQALIADLQPDASARGGAYGLVHFVSGALALPATLLASAIWLRAGAQWAFALDAGVALAASLALLRMKTKSL